MNTAVTAVAPHMQVASLFEKMKPQLAAVLPKHLTAERLCRVALTACQLNPKLLEADKKSLLSAVMTCATLGLEPDGVLGQAYLVPFAGKVQFIPGYKGLIDLARRSGEVSNIIAKEVRSGDDFELTWHAEVPFRHVQNPSGERGDVIGFWALARFKDGGFHFDYLTKQEVDEIRDASNGYISAKRFAKNGVINSPWVSNYIEMGKKTAIRRIAKYLPMSVAKAAAIEGAADAGRHAAFDSDVGDIVIDQFSETEEVAPSPKKTTKLQQLASKQPVEESLEAFEERVDQHLDVAREAEKAAPKQVPPTAPRLGREIAYETLSGEAVEQALSTFNDTVDEIRSTDYGSDEERQDALRAFFDSVDAPRLRRGVERHRYLAGQLDALDSMIREAQPA